MGCPMSLDHASNSLISKSPIDPRGPDRPEFRTGDVLVSAPPALTALPPEVVLHVLSYLDAESLCAAARSCRALRAVSSEASLWRRLGLTLGALPWPPSRPRALHTLRVCSYHCPSSERAQRALAWLAGGASEGAPLPVRRLELVGRHLDADTVRASMQLCTTACELVLRDVHVQAEWLPALAAFDNLAAVHLDWHTEMSCEQVLQLSSSYPSLQVSQWPLWPVG